MNAAEVEAERSKGGALGVARVGAFAAALGGAVWYAGAFSLLPVAVLAAAFVLHARGQRAEERARLNELATEAGRMRRELAELGADAADVLQGLRRASARINETGREIGADTERDHGTVDGAIVAIENMRSSSVDVGDTLTRLAPHANETANSVSTLDASIWEIAENTDELRQLMEEVASATTQLSAAVGQIAQGAEQLGASSDTTRERLGRLEHSVRSVETNAAATHRVSEEALSHAKVGIERVQELAGGMRDIDESFRGVQVTIDGLAERSASIEDIVGLIDEIVSRTHLLALNASIIAAQAGEQGRSFAVVAGEVRDLANLTADSTKEIAGHVAAVRDQVDGAVEAVEVGAARVAAGTTLSVAADESLQQIHDGSEQATAMTREIAMATEEQSAELSAVGASMNQVANLVHQIGEATREQNASSRLVLDKLDEMRELAQKVAEACSKQAGNSRQITEATSALAEGIDEIHRATEAQNRISDEVLGGLRNVKELAEAGSQRAGLMRGSVDALDQETARLGENVERLSRLGQD